MVYKSYAGLFGMIDSAIKFIRQRLTVIWFNPHTLYILTVVCNGSLRGKARSNLQYHSDKNQMTILRTFSK